MYCTRCGALNDDSRRSCARCAAPLDAPLPQAARAPGLVAQLAAYSMARPVALSSGVAGRGPLAVAPGLSGVPVARLEAAASDLRPLPRAPSGRGSAAPPRRSALAHATIVAGTALLASAALFLAAQQAAPRLSGALSEWWANAVGGLESGAPAAPPEVAPEPEPGAAPAERLDAGALTEAINAELSRAGLGGVRVSVDPAGVATVTGRLDGEDDRRAVLQWLQSQDGVTAVRDGLQVPPPAAAPIAPAPPAPPPRQSPAAAAPPQPPAPQARPAPQPQAQSQQHSVPAQPAAPGTRPSAAAPPRPPVAAHPTPSADPRPAPPAAALSPAPVEAAPPADAGAIARSVQRELARLALRDVQVEVDPATLQVTLRGKTGDAARKAQALAAARAAAPASRVRDLVFVIEE